jgi:hypothetical protein
MRLLGVIVCSLLLPAIGVAGYASGQSAGQLSVVMRSERAGKEVYSTVLVSNTSNQLLCVSANVFDTKRSHILLKSHGQYVRLRSYADSSADLHFGFNFKDSYFFLRPQQTRKFYVDDSNFDVPAGVYDYQITFPYYLCSDIANSGRVNSGGTIPTNSVDTTGRVYVLGNSKH